MNFNRTFLGFVSFLIFYLLVPIANANSFWINNPSVQIQEWREEDVILNNDTMISNISLKIVVHKKIFDTNNNFTIIFSDPAYKLWDVNFKVCCKPVFINKSQPYDQFFIEINPSNLKWSNFYNYTFFDINLDYTSKNFLKNDKIDKMVFISTNCIPKENCPKPNSLAIQKTVLLPNDIILRSYPKDTFFGRDVNELIFQDFTSTIKDQYYDTKAIMYTDLKKEREDKLLWILFGVFLGALFSLILGFITNLLVNHHYYKKTSKETESLKNELIAKINSLGRKIKRK